MRLIGRPRAYPQWAIRHGIAASAGSCDRELTPEDRSSHEHVGLRLQLPLDLSRMNDAVPSSFAWPIYTTPKPCFDEPSSRASEWKPKNAGRDDSVPEETSNVDRAQPNRHVFCY